MILGLFSDGVWRLTEKHVIIMDNELDNMLMPSHNFNVGTKENPRLAGFRIEFGTAHVSKSKHVR
jgi:hypothetical protein